MIEDWNLEFDFDRAVIIFKYNKDNLGSTPEGNLVILWLICIFYNMIKIKTEIKYWIRRV